MAVANGHTEEAAASPKAIAGQRAVFPYIDPRNTTSELAEAFKVLPFDRNVLKQLAHAETFFPPISKLLGAVLNKQTRGLPALEWQLIVLRTAALIGAHYVFEINTPVALVNGMPNAKRLLIAFGKVDDEFFSARDRLLMQYVESLVRTDTVSDVLLAELKAHFSPREIMEVITIVGLYTIFGRVTNVSRIDEDPEIPGLMDSLRKLTGK